MLPPVRAVVLFRSRKLVCSNRRRNDRAHYSTCAATPPRGVALSELPRGKCAVRNGRARGRATRGDAGVRRARTFARATDGALRRVARTRRMDPGDRREDSARACAARAQRRGQSRDGLRVPHVRQMPEPATLVNLRAMIGRPDAPAATYSVMVGIPFDVMGKRRAGATKRASSSKRPTPAGRGTERGARRGARRLRGGRARGRCAQCGRAERRHRARAARAGAGAAQAKAATALDVALSERVDANAATALDVALSESQYAEATANLARAQRTLVEAQNASQALDLAHDADVRVAALSGPKLPAGLTIETAVARAQREAQGSRRLGERESALALGRSPAARRGHGAGRPPRSRARRRATTTRRSRSARASTSSCRS